MSNLKNWKSKGSGFKAPGGGSGSSGNLKNWRYKGSFKAPGSKSKNWTNGPNGSKGLGKGSS